MEYTEVTIQCSASLTDIFVAELAHLGYDSFLEGEDGQLTASVPKSQFEEAVLESVINKYTTEAPIPFTWAHVAPQNWNKLWESNYPYVIINERCAIRASFHTLPKPYEFELVITPKMSFGTGHHATTILMLRALMAYDFQQTTVLDLGTGTGVLGIMALKLGAASADATDVEEWSVENALENAQENGVHPFVARQGTVAQLSFPNAPYDRILANINKNVILDELPSYAHLLKPQGLFFTSGFYVADLADVEAIAQKQGLHLLAHNELDNWAVGVFRKE